MYFMLILASTCLIPKKDNNEIEKFRHISLINWSLKMITGCLTNRLAVCIDDLIDTSQTTFIKERLTMNNIVVAHEILHTFRINNKLYITPTFIFDDLTLVYKSCN
jgi:phosphoribosylpyrophosphate synthetase